MSIIDDKVIVIIDQNMSNKRISENMKVKNIYIQEKDLSNINLSTQGKLFYFLF